MELVRFLVLIITSLVLLLHNSCAHAVHHQGREIKADSILAGKENFAPAKMGLVHHDSSKAKIRVSGEKDERKVNTEVADDREVMNMMRRDYGPGGKNTGRRKPPINNHNHKH